MTIFVLTCLRKLFTRTYVPLLLMFMLPRLVAFLYGSVPIPILILIAAPVL